MAQIVYVNSSAAPFDDSKLSIETLAAEFNPCAGNQGYEATNLKARLANYDVGKRTVEIAIGDSDRGEFFIELTHTDIMALLAEYVELES